MIETSYPSTGEEFVLPVVGGRRSSMSNADFERACLVHIERLQHGLAPYDSAMMATFCEAVRMVREYSDAMQVRSPWRPASERPKEGQMIIVEYVDDDDPRYGVREYAGWLTANWDGYIKRWMEVAP